jgi:fatty-acyl-CoA synthase
MVPRRCAPWQDEWTELPLEDRARLMARQGVRYPTLGGDAGGRSRDDAAVPRDGATLGEVMLRGNTVMKGYLKNPKATAEAFREGLVPLRRPRRVASRRLHRGEGPLQGHHHFGRRNVSSLEVEECLYRHPRVMEAAVVARPDEKWGETPCAFVVAKPGAGEPHGGRGDRVVPRASRRVQGAETIVFGELPKTSTGKIQKFVLRERARACDPGGKAGGSSC